MRKDDIKKMAMVMKMETVRAGRMGFISRQLTAIDRGLVEDVLEELRHLMFADFFRESDESLAEVDDELVTDNVMTEIGNLIARAIMIYENEKPAYCHERAKELKARFRDALPEIKHLLSEDVKAAYDGDPAASGYKEIIIAYPGTYAIFVHRIAHVLYDLEVPILPRMMSEISHGMTGIDIHPGATIGGGFFIDHGTGIVVGETAVIGSRVKMYQGVTLGAMTTRKARKLSGTKRHPTVGNDVTLYANAVVLGGDTVVGDGSTISGGALVTESLSPGSRV